MRDLFYAGRVEPLLFAVWLVVVLDAVAACLLAVRRARVAKAPVPWVPAIALVAPCAAVVLTILAFTVGHGHPLAQYNDGDSWRWVRWWWNAWIPLLLGSAAGLAFAIGASPAAAKGPSSLGSLWVWGAAGLANLLSLVCVFQNFPDA